MTPDISVSAAATLSLAKAILDLGILLYSKIPPPPNETDLNNDLKFIKDEFMMMRAYLADAAKAGGYQTEAARTWITQVRNLAYDVEDYFQEFVLHLRTTKKPQKPRNTVVDQIRGLKGRIHETNQRYKDYFLSPAFATGEARDPQKLFITMDALLVGKETEKSHIIQLVNKDDKQRQIIPIWGMCGLGKTALAQSICQQRDIISKFKMCAGITLSHPFMVDEVIRSLIYQLGNEEWTYKETLKKMEHEDLIKELNRLLHKEKHLIVLDNVSSIDNWKDLIDLFPEEQCSTASRIIVTTREKSVAEHCSRENMYKLEAMKDDEALELFMNKVPLKVEYFDEQPELMNHAKSIVLKCRGLPLAISAIGGFLATKPRTVQEWGNFNENFYSELDRNPSLKILKTSLTSHCKDLPYHLKLCFLYLSIFCEDQNMIRRKCLIRRWIAEGYLGDMNAEKNGEVYFADFINKSIIQPSPPVDIGGVATIRYCRVHSLLGEISLAQSMEEKFCFVLGSRSSSSQTCDDNVRHLSISSSWRRDANDLKAVGDISHVRSLTVCGKWEPTLKLLENMRMLRVLDLAGTGELLRDHHIEPHLDKLIHLKYLSLRGCRNIFWLTHSLGNLRDLETLDVRGTSMIILPKTIVNLEKLQYIRAGQIPKDEQPTDCMGSAEPKTNTRLTLGGVTKGVIKNSFRSEPKDSGEASKRDTFNKTFFCDGHLLNSRRDKHGIEVPKGTGKLSSLETLGVIDVGARKNTSTELVILTKLRKLGVTGLKRENSQQFFSAIAMLTLLQSLSIRSEGKPGLQECLDGKSSSPPTDIRSLKLYGNLITLPPWISSLQNLAKLKLRSTRLGPDAVYVLGRLPCLAILRLLSNSIEGEDLRFNFQHGTFRSLVLLQLDGLPDLQSIEFKQGATPNLELLQVDNCTDIEKHGCSGLSFLPSLKEVWLKAGHRYSKIFMDDLKKQLEGNPNRSILKDN